MAAQKRFSQDDNITKEHSIKHYKTHTRTSVSRPNSPQREYRQFVKQDRSDVSESVAVGDEWNELGSFFLSFLLTKRLSVRFRKRSTHDQRPTLAGS